MRSVSDFTQQRARMVSRLQEEGVLRDPRVVDAMMDTPREEFLDASHRREAYEDHPVGIGAAQTMSAPHMVAIMCEALDVQPGHRVLEVGTGSGYHAAVVAHLVEPGPITTVEWRAPLAERARRVLARLGIDNAQVIHGDGARGHPESAPFDRIYVTCATPSIPSPLLDQAAQDGIVLAPVGDAPSRLVRARRIDDRWVEEDLGACAFVPLRGEFGVP